MTIEVTRKFKPEGETELDQTTPQQEQQPDTKITVSLPRSVLKQLRARTVDRDTTIRALMLEALAEAGYTVALDEIRDRRRDRTGRKNSGYQTTKSKQPVAGARS